MKLGKLSLVAVMALGTSAFALENVKVSGEAKVWYQTSETINNSYDFFDQPALGDTHAMAHAVLSVGATADLIQNLSSGVELTGVSTLGLENNLVGYVPANRQGAPNALAPADDQGWVSEAWLAYTLGKTTAKIGRQELATPLAFTEKWNSVKNTFEAVVLLNNDIPDTTLVGAWVGKHNSAGGNTTVTYQGRFSTFGALGAADGAYAFGAINKSIPNTTVQAWYYDVNELANAYWLQADGKVMDMIELGGQYASLNPDHSTLSTNDIYALRAGLNIVNSNFYVAYSSADNGNGATNFSNVATGDKSMIYTAAGSIYFDGEHTTKADTDAWRVGASTKAVPGVTLGASYGQADAGTNDNTRSSADYEAWDVTASGKVGPLGLTAIYTQYDVDYDNIGLTDVDTDTIRIIASLKF